MSLWKIAWRSIQQRAMASGLTAFSMALGVSLVVAVLVVYGVVYQSFHRGGGGYDLVVGASKGSRLELVLNAVYYLGRSLEPMPYAEYKKLAEGWPKNVEVAVPICLGDTYEGFRVVGTTPDLFEQFCGPGDQEFKFEPGGRNFKNDSPDNYFEAVVGAAVARRTGLTVGSTFRPTHDVSGRDNDKHRPFTVVGVLQPTGTPHDRALFVNVEGFYRQPGHNAAEAAHDEHADHDDHDDDPNVPIPDKQKRVTAVLVRLSEFRPTESGPGLSDTRATAKEINQQSDLQAAVPNDEIADLFEKTIGNLQLVLLVFAVMIVVVAGIGIMVSIYNSMNDRRHEIAIMRALGASRATVMLVILLESILLSLGGGVLGLLLGHGLIGLFGPVIAEQTGVAVGLLQFRTIELILIPTLVVLASVVGYLPAVAAYRTDVAQALTATP